MGDDLKPGVLYWRLLHPIWTTVSIYDGPEVFLRDFSKLPPEVGHLFATHWCQYEVCNGGLYQFFSNSTGILAPEALAGFQAIDLQEWAGILSEAMQFFAAPYPRDRAERKRLLPYPVKGKRQEWDPFGALDGRFYAWLHPDWRRWNRAADAYATHFVG